MTRGEVKAALVALLLGSVARAEAPVTPGEDDPHAACRAAAATAQAAAPAPPADARVQLAQAELVDQSGRPVSFREGAVGDDVVVMDFVFTSCTTVCPVLSAKFARLQDRLAERLGKGVRLVSVTIDPARDTPERLRAYAGRWKARPGWSFLTGELDQVEKVLRGLGAYTPSFGDHAPMVLVGDGRTGAWSRFNGFPDVDRIAAHVESLLAAREGPRTAAAGGTRP